MKKLWILSLLVSTATILFFSCSKNDDGPEPEGYRVEYRATGSGNVEINEVRYSNFMNDLVTLTDIGDSVWVSNEMTFSSLDEVPPLQLTAEGVSLDGETGELRAEIIVNGEVADADVATGTILTAAAKLELLDEGEE